jgi:hypothetical protein
MLGGVEVFMVAVSPGANQGAHQSGLPHMPVMFPQPPARPIMGLGTDGVLHFHRDGDIGFPPPTTYTTSILKNVRRYATIFPEIAGVFLRGGSAPLLTVPPAREEGARIFPRNIQRTLAWAKQSDARLLKLTFIELI